jgi:predicted peptidase
LPIFPKFKSAMKILTLLALRCLLTSMAIVLLVSGALAQQTARRSPAGVGYLEYLPPDYLTSGKRYPLLIYFHGNAERGNGTTDIWRVAQSGPPMHIRNGHPMTFTVNGQAETFIVISPQVSTSFTSFNHIIPTFIPFILDNYRNYIDVSRIYLTGTRMGGAAVFFAAAANPSLYAAIVPSATASWPDTPSPCQIAGANLPVWAHHGTADSFFPISHSREWVRRINACLPAPNPLARLREYTGLNHDIAGPVYATDNSANAENVYEWMLKFRRASAVPPSIATTGTLSALSAVAGTASATTSFSVSGTNLSGPVQVAAPANFEVSLAQAGPFAATVAVGGAGNFGPLPVFVRLRATAPVGSHSGNIVLSSAGAASVNVPIPASTVSPVPTITVTGTLVALSTVAGTASAATSFEVSGTNLTASIQVASPPQFEVSLSEASGYAGSLTLGGAGTMPATQVFVRLRATAPLGSYSGNIVLSSAGAASLNVPIPASTVSPVPTVTATGTLSALSTVSGTASATTSFQVSGTNLSSPVQVSAPENFEVSLAQTGPFAATVSVGGAGNFGPLPVYVRLAASAPVGTYSGNIALTGGGAASVNVAIPASTVSSPPTPAINATGTLSALSTVVGTASATTSFQVSGTALTGAVQVLAQENFEVSLAPAGPFAATLAVGGAGNFGPLPVHVRLTAAAPVGTYSGNIALTGGGADSVAVAIPASTVSPPPTPAINATGTLSALSTVVGTASATTSFQVSGTALTGAVQVAVPANFEVSLAPAGPFAATLAVGGAGNFGPFPVHVRLTAAAPVGTYSGNIALTGGGADSVAVAIPASTVLPVPTITATGTLSALSTVAGTASAATSFEVSGSNLTASIQVTPPAQFEVSLSEANGYAGSLTLGGAGMVPATQVFVRLRATALVGSYSDNIVLSSAGAVSANVAIPASTVSPVPTITAIGTLSALSTVVGTASATTSFQVSGINLSSPAQVSAPTNFEVSLAQAGPFAATLQVGGVGNFGPVVVYVRLSATAPVGTYSGNLALTGGGAASVNVAIPASTVSPVPTITPSGTPSALSTVAGTASATTSFQVSGINLSGAVQVAVPTHFEVSLAQAGPFAATLQVGGAGNFGPVAVYVRLRAAAPVGTYSGNVALTGGGAASVNVAIPTSTVAPVTTGTINVAGISMSFVAIVGAPTSASFFSVSGTNLSAGVLVTAPPNFEVSAREGNTFTSSITVGAAGNLAPVNVLIRLRSGIPVGTYNGQVVCSSPGAAEARLTLPEARVLPAGPIAGGQTAQRTSGGVGYLEYLPADHATSGKKYPLLIYLHGAGDKGNGTSDIWRVARMGPALQIQNGHRMNFMVNGQEETFIVVSPQLTTSLADFSSLLTPFANAIFTKHANIIDRSRVYITGISAGGAAAWLGTVANPSWYAAIAPVCGALWPSGAQPCQIATGNVPVLAHHGTADGIIPINHSREWIWLINRCASAPNPAALVREYAGLPHDISIPAYATDNSYNPVNLYQWLLQFRKPSVVTWNGTAWSPNAPTAADNVVVSGNYPGSNPGEGSFVAKALNVAAGVTVNVADGQTITVNNRFENAGIMVVENGGALLQGSTGTIGAFTGTFTLQRRRDNPAANATTVNYNLWSAPVAGQTVANLPGAAQWKYDFNPSNLSWRAFTTGALVAGRGYSAAQPATQQSVSFAGRPHNGNISIAVATSTVASTTGNNLLGNPYPSALDLRAFFTDPDNNELNGSAWLFFTPPTGQGSPSYQVANELTGIRYVPSARGFFVRANTAGTVIFKNQHRASGNNQMFNREEGADFERFALDVRSPDGSTDRAYLGIGQRFSTGFDPGYDANKAANPSELDLSLLWDNAQWATLALPADSLPASLPMVVQVKQSGEYWIQAPEVPSRRRKAVWLEDRATGQFYNLGAANDYALNLSSGRYHNRFFLLLDSPQDRAEASNALHIYSHNNQIYVGALGSAGGPGQVAVYDLMGRLVLKVDNVELGPSFRQIDAKSVEANGVYVVRVQTGSQVAEQKIYLSK